MATRTLDNPPSVMPLYARAAAPLIPGASWLPFVPGGGGEVPELDLSLMRKADPEAVAAYARFCGFAVRDRLPATYPHVLAFPLHMAVLADGRFPFGSVGLLHIENRIEQRRPIGLREELKIRVRPTSLRPHPRGCVFSLLTEVRSGREKAWESETTILRRGKSPSERSDGDEFAVMVGIRPKVRTRPGADAEARPASATWKLGGDLGRRYASVSGDRNPIHMHALTAKPLGFPGAIAHGMWTKTRCLAALERELPDAFAVSVRFRKPIVLPARVEFACTERGEEIGFEVRDAKRGTRHLSGQVEPLAEATKAKPKAKPQSKGRKAKVTVTATDKGVAERGMGFGLRAINRLAGSDLLDRIGIRKQVERALFQTTKNGFRSATVAGRTFKAAQQLGKPARQKKGKSTGLFDLSPDDEQQMFQEAVGAFAAEKVRPAALEADADCSTPPELLNQANELGVNILGVPEKLGGVMHEQSATTSVLVGEALAHGDMGIAYAALAPGAVATAIGLWGSAEQEAAYLPAFSGENVPAAALALLEPRPLFDPLRLQTTARREGGEWVLDGAKSLLARAKQCELFLVAAEAEGVGPALFLIESGTKGLEVEPEPAMGLRAAATGRLLLDGVRVPANALLGGEGEPADYAECVNRSRVAWCGLAAGTARAVLDYVIPYVNERQAFGEPVSNRQGVAFAVSDIGIEAEGMRLATYRAASRADRGESFAREAAIARRLCAAKAMEIGSAGVQLLGGHGFVKEHPVERWYRDLRAAGVMEGALLV